MEKELFAPEEAAKRPVERHAAAPRFSQKKSARQPGPKISVVIPAHNEEAYLGRTLAALHQQTFPAHEIIVVANGCTDRTEEAARGLCDRLIIRSQQGLSAARNAGARVADGELLVFLDADTLLEPGALQ